MNRKARKMNIKTRALINSSVSDIEMEDTTLHQRFFSSAARGRPSSNLKGKNGFLWKTHSPSRRSGKYQSQLLVHFC